MIVERSDVTLTRIAGSGGFGTVHDVMAPWGGRHTRMAFKEPLAGHLEAQRTLAQMARMVAFRDNLSPLDRGALDLVSAWPVAMVEDRGMPVGALMPSLDDFEVTGLNKDGKLDKVLFALSWLPAPEELTRRQKIDRRPYTDVVMRLALAAHLALCVATIHRLGMVIGDLSLTNAVASASPPRVVLLDCDAFALLTDGSRKQGHSPGYTPPEIASGAKRLQDHQTDVYKLGLCLLRMLIMGRGAVLATDPALTASVLPPDGVDLLRRCLSPNRALRPSAQELFDYFEDRVLTMAQPPSILSAALSQTTAVRGRDFNAL